MALIVWSDACPSASLVMHVTRRSWNRIVTAARLRAFSQAVRHPLVGLVGSTLPLLLKGKT